MLLWLAFIICTAAIIYSGSRLSRYGDIIAEKTGLGRTWVGFIMLASITSLPELITGISAVTISNVPDIAIGDVLGRAVDRYYPHIYNKSHVSVPSEVAE